MGLDTTHDCWHGSYSSFGRWRVALTQAAGLPSLNEMAGFSKGSAPLSWEPYRSDPLVLLLDHSDCDGELAAEDCGRIADRLDELLPSMPQEWRQATAQFSVGLRAAAAAGEDVEFR